MEALRAAKGACERVETAEALAALLARPEDAAIVRLSCLYDRLHAQCFDGFVEALAASARDEELRPGARDFHPGLWRCAAAVYDAWVRRLPDAEARLAGCAETESDSVRDVALAYLGRCALARGDVESARRFDELGRTLHPLVRCTVLRDALASPRA